MGNWTASIAERLLLILRWTPFPAMSGRDPPKRGPPPHQFRPLPFSRCWTPFPAMSGRDPPKRGPPPHQFRPLPFSRCWIPFPAVSGRDPTKRGPPPHQFRPLPFSRRLTLYWAVSGRDPPKRGAATWPQCSFHFGFNLLFLWRRESALLLCKRIPLKIVYAWPPSIAPLQCKGLNFTSASVMGSWTASSAERLLLIYRWTPFPAMSGRDPPKRGPQPHQFRPLPFSRCWIPFPAVSGRDPTKRGPPPHQFRPLPFSRRLTPYWAVSGRDPPKRGAATWPQCSFHFGFNLLFLWRRESALLLCKRIPLKIVYAWPASVAPLQCKGLNLTSAVMGNWTASFAERLLLILRWTLFQPLAAEILQKGGRRHISSDLYLFPGAWPLIEPWAAEILQKGAPQPDIKRAAIWFFSVPLPHIEAVPLSALSVPVLCACLLVRVAFFWQIPFPKHCSEWGLPSTTFTPGWPSSLGRADGFTPPRVMCLSFLLAFACTVVRVLLLEGKCIASCKRIPLKIVYAWPASIAPLQCKGLNLTSASVMGNWTASIAERLLLILRWTPFPAISGRDPPKRGPPPHQFRPLPFSRCWTPFPAESGRDPPKRVLQLDLNVASISASTCFFLWRRESALLLCKRNPLKIVYAWPPSIAPLQCKGLNFTSASVMGSWTASSAERLLLIYRWTPFPAMNGRDPPKRGPQPHQFRPLPFSRCWIPFPAVSGRDPPKRGPPPHQFRPLPFSRRLTPYWAVSGRDPPKRGAATWPQCSFHFGFNLLFSLAQGKCIASLQEDPAEDSLCLASFYCATTVQGLEPDLRCDGKLDCFFCWTASPYFTLDPFPAISGRDPPKRGPPPHQFRPLPFSRRLTPYWAVSGRDPPKRGAATWHQTCCHLVLLSVFATHRGCTTVSSLGSCPLCLSACQGCFLLADPFPEHCSEWGLPSTPFTPGWPSSVGRADGS